MSATVRVQSDLFRESGSNATTSSAKIRDFAQVMRSNRGWGPFPPITGVIQKVDWQDIDEYEDALEDGYEHELAWSRPLTRADVGKVFVAIQDGHNRAYAAQQVGIPLVVKRGGHMAATKNACVITVGNFGGSRCLLKNRDRTYKPAIKIIHEVIDGTEVAYLYDVGTDWSEGMNEAGIGIVNSALAVGRDEAEKKIIRQVGKKSKDGERIRKALGQTTLDEAVDVLCTYHGGVKGHTFISDQDRAKSVEATTKHECVVKPIRGSGNHVRTNHGFVYEDAGYTEGENYISTVARRNHTMRVLRGVDDPLEIAPALVRARKKNRQDPNNIVRDTDNMVTSSQMVLNLTNLEMLVYLIPGKVTFKGVENRLPGKRQPKINVRVFRYKGIKLDDPKVTNVKLSQRVAARYLYGGLPEPPPEMVNTAMELARSYIYGDILWTLGFYERNGQLTDHLEDVRERIQHYAPPGVVVQELPQVTFLEFNFKNWKYRDLLERHGGVRELQRNGITRCILRVEGGREDKASWDHGKHRMLVEYNIKRLNLPRTRPFQVLSVLEKLFDAVRLMVKHEMGHMTQTIMRTLFGVDWREVVDDDGGRQFPGLPSKRIRTPEFLQSLEGWDDLGPAAQALTQNKWDKIKAQGVKPSDIHDLDDIEFYPMLLTLIDDFKKDNWHLTGDVRKEKAREYLDSMVTVQRLRKYPRTQPKWKKFVKEFYKAVL